MIFGVARTASSSTAAEGLIGECLSHAQSYRIHGKRTGKSVDPLTTTSHGTTMSELRGTRRRLAYVLLLTYACRPAFRSLSTALPSYHIVLQIYGMVEQAGTRPGRMVIRRVQLDKTFA